MIKRIFLIYVSLFLFVGVVNALERPDREFKIFQFPSDKIPVIDGDSSDWQIVPDDYAVGMDELEDDVYKSPIDKKDKDANVRVGWVKGLNVLYFLYESYDDYWRVSKDDLINDIFEISVDGDASGDTLIMNMHPDAETIGLNNLFFAMHGVHAQNYHIFTPPGEKNWCFVWGSARWAKYLPWANAAYKKDFKGDSGKLTLEFWITPFDYASWEGPDRSIPSKLEENKIIGLTWGISDYDSILIDGRPSGNNYDGQFNLSHDIHWFVGGANACAFRLMPLEPKFRPMIKAWADFKIIDMEKHLVAFIDHSSGNINKWTWDFGDGTTSNEPNPIHVFKNPQHYGESLPKPITLTVAGPDGTSRFSFVHEEIFIKKGQK